MAAEAGAPASPTKARSVPKAERMPPLRVRRAAPPAVLARRRRRPVAGVVMLIPRGATSCVVGVGRGEGRGGGKWRETVERHDDGIGKSRV